MLVALQEKLKKETMYTVFERTIMIKYNFRIFLINYIIGISNISTETPMTDI